MMPVISSLDSKSLAYREMRDGSSEIAYLEDLEVALVGRRRGGLRQQGGELGDDLVVGHASRPCLVDLRLHADAGRLVERVHVGRHVVHRVGGVLGRGEGDAGEHVDVGVVELLPDDGALGVLLDDVLGQLGRVADRAVVLLDGRVLVGADDADDGQRLRSVHDRLHVLLVARTISPGAVFVLAVVGARQHQFELQVEQLVVRVALHIGLVELLARIGVLRSSATARPGP